MSSIPLSAKPIRTKLEWLFGVDAYLRAVKFNVLPTWPGSSGKGSHFPVAQARDEADAIRCMINGVAVEWTVVILGFRAASAFCYRSQRPESREYFSPWQERNSTFSVIPHPSGVNRWWNDPLNRRRAVRWCRHAAREGFSYVP